jgi:TRAP-type C4-dicarboxylate transport system permease small subunit
MEGFWKFFDTLSDFMAALAGCILVVITAAVCYTIFMRFLFKQTSIWIIPMCEYSLLWIVFLGTTWLLRGKGHITTDIIYVHLSEKSRQNLDFVMAVIGCLACALLFGLGISHLYDCLVNGVTDVRSLTVPKAAVFVIVPIGSCLLTLQFFRMAWSGWTPVKKAS